jgi:O-antigen ligase
MLLGVLSLTHKHYLQPILVKSAVLGVVAAIGGVWMLSRPKYGLYVLIFYVYSGFGFYLQFNAAYLIILAVGAAVGLGLLRGGTLQVPTAGFLWAAACFTLLAVQSIAQAFDVSLAVASLFIWLKSLFLVFVVVQLLRKPRDVERFALAIFAGTVLAVAFGVINMWFGWARDISTVGGNWVRFTGTHEDPNVGAVFLASALPLGIYAIRRYRHWALRVVFAVATALVAAAVFWTFSRGAVFQVGFIVLAVLIRDLRRWAIIPLSAVALMAAFLVPDYYWHRLLSLEQLLSGATEDYSIMIRLKALIAAWKLFVAHPIAGIGLNNFEVRSELHMRLMVHNAYLETLVSTGILGFAAMVSALVVVFRQFRVAMRARWGEATAWMRHLVFYFLISLISTLIGAFFLSIMFAYAIWLLAAAGLAVGAMARSHSATGPSAGEPGKNR